MRRHVTNHALAELLGSGQPANDPELGYYGMAWSVYSHILARGADVEFPKNAMIDLRFNERPQEEGGAKIPGQ